MQTSQQQLEKQDDPPVDCTAPGFGSTRKGILENFTPVTFLLVDKCRVGRGNGWDGLAPISSAPVNKAPAIACPENSKLHMREGPSPVTHKGPCH